MKKTKRRSWILASLLGLMISPVSAQEVVVDSADVEMFKALAESMTDSSSNLAGKVLARGEKEQENEVLKAWSDRERLQYRAWDKNRPLFKKALTRTMKKGWKGPKYGSMDEMDLVQVVQDALSNMVERLVVVSGCNKRDQLAAKTLGSSGEEGSQYLELVFTQCVAQTIRYVLEAYGIDDAEPIAKTRAKDALDQLKQIGFFKEAKMLPATSLVRAGDYQSGSTIWLGPLKTEEMAEDEYFVASVEIAFNPEGYFEIKRVERRDHQPSHIEIMGGGEKPFVHRPREMDDPIVLYTAD